MARYFVRLYTRSTRIGLEKVSLEARGLFVTLAVEMRAGSQALVDSNGELLTVARIAAMIQRGERQTRRLLRELRDADLLGATYLHGTRAIYAVPASVASRTPGVAPNSKKRARRGARKRSSSNAPRATGG